MKATRRALLGGLLLALCGCAGNSPAPTVHASAGGGEDRDPCRAAIDDVTAFCSEKNFSRGKCEDAKSRSRQFCI